MLRKLLNGVITQKQDERRAELYRNLIRHEARIGGSLFGSIPKGGRREFFCLDKHTWVWHEEWIDKNGRRQIKTTRYDVRPDGILKSQNGRYQQLSKEEADRLVEAAELYEKRIYAEIYSAVA